MRPKTILDSTTFTLTVNRLCYQLIENHDDFSGSALVGLQPRGIQLAGRIRGRLCEILKKKEIPCGSLDVTFSRDDFRRRHKPIAANKTRMDFLVEEKKVVLIDDVLFTGRTVRAGMDEILAYGRPSLIELLVLIDRRFSRQLPIQPTYVGHTVDSIASERVKVEWKETEGRDRVVLYSTAGSEMT